jgi:hypothetical protein
MDLELQIGDVLHLELPHDGGTARVRLMGLVPGRSLLVTAPEVKGRLLPVAEDDVVAARAFSGDEQLSFSCMVQRCCTTPYPYLHLSFPASFDVNPRRHAPRARVHLTGTAEADASPGKEVAITLHDISNLGARVWSTVPLGAVGEGMLLRLPLEPHALTENFAELLCEIRNVQEDFDSMPRRWGYGVEFVSVSSADALALRALVLRKLGERS